MAVVEGFLSDAGLGALSGRYPRLKFKLTRAVAAGPQVLVTDPVEATLNDNTGAFSVTLQATDVMVPEATYTVIADWDAGQELDVITGLRVPSGTWSLSELLTRQWQTVRVLLRWGDGPPPETITDGVYLDISGDKPVLYVPEGGI